MNITISLGNRAIYAVYTDRSGSKRLVHNGHMHYFAMHLWCNGKQAYFGDAAIKQSIMNYTLFYPDLMSEVRKTPSKRTKFSYSKVKLGLSGVLALLFKDVRQKILTAFLEERLIHMTSEPLHLTLVLPDDIYKGPPEAKELIESAFKMAGYHIRQVIPEYLATVFAYNLNVNRSGKTIRVLHLDLGDKAKINHLEINEDSNVNLMTSQIVDLGIKSIEDLIIGHIQNEFKNKRFAGHDSFPDSLNLDERLDYELKLIKFINNLMVSTEESLRFVYSTHNKETLEVDIDLYPRDCFDSMFDIGFVFSDRIIAYQSALFAAISNFINTHSIADQLDKIVFSGAGFRFPALVEGLKNSLISIASIQFLRQGIDYSSVIAFGGSAYSDVSDEESDHPLMLNTEEQRLTDLVNSVVTEPWVISTRPAISMDVDIRYDLPPDANHIRLSLSDKERIYTKIEIIADGDTRFFDQYSSKQIDIECLDVNFYHVCLSELKAKELYFIAESDTELNNLDFCLEVSDLIRDNYHYTLDKKHLDSVRLKHEKIKLLRLYPYKESWRLLPCLESIDIPLAPPKPAPRPPTPSPDRSEKTKKPASPVISQSTPESSTSTVQMVEGGRYPLADNKYQIDLFGQDFSLFLRIPRADGAARIYSSKTQVSEIVSFNSENSLNLNLSQLGKNNVTRAEICLASNASAKKKQRFSCSTYSMGHQIQRFELEGDLDSQYTSILLFYMKDDKWRVHTQVEKLPGEITSTGISENSDMTQKKSAFECFVAGEKYTLPQNMLTLRVDFVGQISPTQNLTVSSLSSDNKKNTIWKLEQQSHIVKLNNNKKGVSLLFDLNSLLLDQYVCIGDGDLQNIESMMFLDANSKSPIKHAGEPSKNIQCHCNYLFKLYKYKSVWKIGYLCD